MRKMGKMFFNGIKRGTVREKNCVAYCGRGEEYKGTKIYIERELNAVVKWET